MNRSWMIALALVLAGAATAPAAEETVPAAQEKAPAAEKAAAVPQETFATPEEAAKALVDAAKAGDTAKLEAILGPGSEDIVDSADDVADARARAEFVERAGKKLAVEKVDDSRGIVVIGDDDWPFPLPLVRTDGKWSFDAPAGVEEILNRRIGRNELYTIAVAQEYVAAQREYARLQVAAGKPQVYAQRFASTPNQHDGLYWETKEGEPESPLGPLVARGENEGYGKPRQGGGGTFHGYKYRILTGQGPNAPGGARTYLKDGALSGGFGLLAFPAEYGETGVMTFIVNQQGVVFEKDLGENTVKKAETIAVYNPDRTWAPAMMEP
jgi:hypothetical protein